MKAQLPYTTLQVEVIVFNSWQDYSVVGEVDNRKNLCRGLKKIQKVVTDYLHPHTWRRRYSDHP
jgi:hypothetical protein